MTTAPLADEYQVPRRQAHFALIVLTLLMAFDFIDRQVLASLLPAIKQEWALSDTRLGMLVSSVNVAIALLALPTAMVVDRWSRSRSIGVMAVMWSLATGACMLAGNFYQLLVARFAIGTGEAGYVAGGNALLSALYPARLRATVIGIFQSGGLIGSVLGVVLGGFIAKHWGWRSAFGVVALPGLLLAVLVFFIRDYKTVSVTVTDEQSGLVREVSWLDVIVMMLRTPVLLLVFIAQASQLFFVSTFGNWLPSFLNRVHGLPLDKAGLQTGLTLIVAAAGTAVGGWAIDRFSRQRPHRRLFGAALFALLTAVLFVLAFSVEPSALQRGLMFGGAFCMTAVLGPAMAAVSDLVHPGMRTSALGMLVTTTNLFGMALGPTLGGMLADSYDLQTALLIVSFAPLIGAVGYAMAGLRYNRGRMASADAQLSMA